MIHYNTDNNAYCSVVNGQKILDKRAIMQYR